MEIQKLEAAVEAILFAVGDSVELKNIAYAIDHNEKTTRKILNSLMDKYGNEDRGIRIVEIDNSFQMCTKKEMHSILIKLLSHTKNHVLTDVLLETLSIIAYKQPTTKLEIEKIRGVKCDHAVNKLIEYNLITEVGRLDAPGKPLLFGTTREFLRQFGVKSIDELPEVNEDKIEDLKLEVKEEVQLKLDL